MALHDLCLDAAGQRHNALTDVIEAEQELQAAKRQIRKQSIAGCATQYKLIASPNLSQQHSHLQSMSGQWWVNGLGKQCSTDLLGSSCSAPQAV